MLSCMFCAAINAFICVSCAAFVRTPIQKCANKKPKQPTWASPHLLMTALMNNCHTAIGLAVETTDCERERERESVGGGRDSMICYDYSNRALCNYSDEVFSYCAEKI